MTLAAGHSTPRALYNVMREKNHKLIAMKGTKRARTPSSTGAVAGKRFKFERRQARPSTSVLLAETKYLDTLVNNTSVTSTAVVDGISDIASGDNYNQRNGNMIRAKYIQYNCFISNIVATTTAPYMYAVYLVLDRQPNGTAPLVSDIFDTSTISFPYSMKRINSNQERFRILAHHQGVCATVCSEDAQVKGFVDLQKLDDKDRVIRYSGTGAVEPNTNGFYLVYATNGVTANQVVFQGGFRFAFNDV